MSLKYKILPLTVLLAVGIALTACGSCHQCGPGQLDGV